MSDIMTYILTTVAGIGIMIIGYFLNRVFKRVDEIEGDIKELKQMGNSRDIQLGIMKNDVENKHHYLNEKIDTINTNVKELIIEIKILARELAKKQDNE